MRRLIELVLLQLALTAAIRLLPNGATSKPESTNVSRPMVTMTSRGLRDVDDDLLGASMEQIIAKRARMRADFVRLWADIDALLDERLECMASRDDCDSEVRA